jgi:cytochrome c oxidase subunit IV
MSTAHPVLRTYLVVYALLMAGLAATVGIAYLPHGPWSLPGALAIAFGKATLVVLIFMHVRYSPRLTWIAVFAGLVWLAILLAVVSADYASRHWLPVKPIRTELVMPPDDESFEPKRAASSLGTEGVPHAAEP